MPPQGKANKTVCPNAFKFDQKLRTAQHTCAKHQRQVQNAEGMWFTVFDALFDLKWKSKDPN